jgi:hypothetical protein
MNIRVSGLMQENTAQRKDMIMSSGGISCPRVRAFHALIEFCVLVLLTCGSAWAQDGRGYLEVGGGYKTGDFGTPVRSNLYYFSPILGYATPLYEVSVTVPYLFLSNSSGGRTNSESGIGDIILRGSKVLVPEGKSGFSLDGALAIKLPTADETKGLGTGETDYGAFLSAHKRVDKFKLSLLSGYIKVGDPPSVNFNDIYLYGIGISRIFGSTELFTSFEGRRAVIPGAKNPQEINVGFFHVMNAYWAVKGGTFAGLNKGGPDFGLNFGLVRWF